ncbi:hypothetical protein OG361_06175 [Streptomyces sp. NBC_00090]|uniref:hypothetical protein n=1 Tax=Streptomyces sp. NBC_00090 TaxID=2903619 RepID=UPI00324A1107
MCRKSRLPAGALVRALDPAALVRVPAERWDDTSRVDLTAWPARGAGTGDAALLRRALDAWARGAATDVRLTATPGTATAPPAEPPRLLYAGTVDAAGVVLLHDGRRLARYAEPRDGGGPAALDRARGRRRRHDGCRRGPQPHSGAGAAPPRALDRRGRGTRPPRARHRGPPPGRRPGRSHGPRSVRGPGGCTRAPALQLTSSSRIVEDHAFLLADLGELTPAHLTWTPSPGTGVPARAPREATGERGLAAWARSACSLAPLHGTGVRSVNRWEYAEQALPDGAGRAVWVCSRVDTWEGSGRASVSFEPPTAPSPPDVPSTPSVPSGTAGTTGTVPRAVVELRNTAACSRFGQHVLAGTYWTAPSGRRYLLAAGSRRLTGITAGGAVSATGRGPVLSAAAGADGPVRTVRCGSRVGSPTAPPSPAGRHRRGTGHDGTYRIPAMTAGTGRRS